jgi:O-antigen/teichoic acid export membrane protein
MLERRRFLLDWSANFASLGFLAISGILINSLVTKYYGAAALGVFNQVFAVYILGAQLATAGVQYSVLRYVAVVGDDRALFTTIVYAAVAVGSVAATAIVALTWLIFALVGTRIYSGAVVDGIFLMLPGLWCFAINKILLNALNGLQFNRLFAAFTAARYALMSVATVVAVAVGVQDYQLSLILSASEGLLLVALALAFLRLCRATGLLPAGEWVRNHFRFGLRSMLGGMAIELNTRVDVLVLGLFTNDTQVGIYSFAAFFVEGLLQLPQLSRRIVDPVLTKLVANSDRDELSAFLRRGRNLGAAFMLAVTVTSIALYPLVATVLGDRAIAERSWSVFVILMIGAAVFGTYGTFGGLLSQAGLPVAQSQSNVLILITNAALNIALVPTFGINGAALATGASFVLGTFYFRALVARHLAVRF